MTLDALIRESVSTLWQRPSLRHSSWQTGPPSLPSRLTDDHVPVYPSEGGSISPPAYQVIADVSARKNTVVASAETADSEEYDSVESSIDQVDASNDRAEEELTVESIVPRDDED